MRMTGVRPEVGARLPPTLFRSCPTGKTKVAGLGTQKIGDSAPPPPKKWLFFAPKMA